MIRLFKVQMASEAKELVGQVLDSGYIGQGQKVEEFETELKRVFELDQDVITVNSATSGLDLALHMIGVREGDEVITTPITCTATNSPIVNRHAIPVWADVDNCGLINPIDVARKITNKTKAIMAVNWGGSMPNYTALKSFGIPVIEDAAHGTYWSAKERGNYVVWSFQAIKHLICGDGGALVSPDPERARLLRWYGLNRRTSASFRCEQNIQEVGYKYHMNDINAAIGLCNLKYLRDNVSASRFNAHYYYNNIKNSRVTLLDYDDNSSYWIYTILVDNPKKFIAYMAEREIEASPVHARNDKHAGFYYPNGELKGVDYFDAHQVSIPNGAWISHKELQYIVDTINSYKGE